MQKPVRFLRFGVIVLATLAHGVKLGRRPGETFGGFFFIGQAFYIGAHK